MRSKENPLCVTFEDIPEGARWNELKKALKTQYTMSYKDICRTLMCSRSWADRYLRPHLHYIYLSRVYVILTRHELGRSDSDQTWYDREEFEKLILDNITIDRQTISVPTYRLMDESRYGEYIARKKEIEEEYKGTQNYVRKENSTMKLINDYLDPNLKTIIATQYRRTLYSHVPIPKDSLRIDINKLMALHDTKDYGDTDETVLRGFFCDGCYRLTLRIPDVDGVVSEKVYYYNIPDEIPMDEKNKWGITDTTPVNYELYVSEYNNI